MRSELHVMELVDRYLDGGMNGTERSAFEQRLAGDDELHGLVEEQRALREGLARVPLRAVAARAHNAWIIRRAMPYVLGGAIVVSLGAYLLTTSPGEAERHAPTDATTVEANVLNVLEDEVPAAVDTLVGDTAPEAMVEATHVESVFMQIEVSTMTNEEVGADPDVSRPVAAQVDSASRTASEDAAESPATILWADSVAAGSVVYSSSGHERPLVKARPLLATVELPVNAAQPHFPGGMEEMQRFIVENLRQPRGRNKSGVVTIGFTVNKKGELVNVDVVEGLDPAFDAEAVRVIRCMPDWTPAFVGERPVKSRVEVPIRFEGKRKKQDLE